MSAIDDIVQGMSGVIEKITETSTATSGVMQEAEEALGQAEALGATSIMQGLNQVKEQIEAVLSQLGGVNSAADEVVTSARALADGT